MNAELKPCPFCGGDPDLMSNEFGDGYLAFVMCMTCYSTGAEKPTDKDAVEAWNTRAAPKVKELVWEPQEIARLATPGTYLTVETHLGCYELHQFEYRNGRVSGCMLRTPATADLIGFDREADAKDAAQADYKRRALSCFEGANDGEM